MLEDFLRETERHSKRSHPHTYLFLNFRNFTLSFRRKLFPPSCRGILTVINKKTNIIKMGSIPGRDRDVLDLLTDERFIVRI
jgi:hypothetical protein